MHVKNKYRKAIEDAIDFIECNVDGASEENTESDTLKILREISQAMGKSQHKRMVRYYIRKNTVNKKQ